MNTIEIAPLGEIPMSEPGSWCAIGDLSTAWVNIKENEKAEIIRTRICAAAIGVVCSGDVPTAKGDLMIPRYDWATGDLLLYGGKVQDLLMRKGVKVSDICLSGIKVFRWLTDLIPSHEEGQKAANFTEQAEAQQI